MTDLLDTAARSAGIAFGAVLMLAVAARGGWRLLAAGPLALADDRRIGARAWAALAVLLASGLLAAVDYLHTPVPWRPGRRAFRSLRAAVRPAAADQRAAGPSQFRGLSRTAGPS